MLRFAELCLVFLILTLAGFLNGVAGWVERFGGVDAMKSERKKSFYQSFIPAAIFAGFMCWILAGILLFGELLISTAKGAERLDAEWDAERDAEWDAEWDDSGWKTVVQKPVAEPVLQTSVNRLPLFEAFFRHDDCKL